MLNGANLKHRGDEAPRHVLAPELNIQSIMPPSRRTPVIAFDRRFLDTYVARTGAC